MDTQDPEVKLTNAINALKAGTVPSVRKAAELFDVKRTTLRDRLRGIRPIRELHKAQQKLTPEEEAAIKKSLFTLAQWGWPATIRYLRSLATEVLRSRGDHRPLGQHWYKNFLTRHSDLKPIWSRNLDQSRKDAADHSTLQKWFELYNTMCARYGIPVEDRYNMDEKGFMKGIGDNGKVIIPVSEKEAWSTQPGNRDWVSVISCINAESYSVPGFVIFKGSQIQHSWFGNQIDNRTVIQVSPNGWTDCQIALEWLKHFNTYTKPRIQAKYRLLILDGHISHVSLPFIQYCEQEDIIAICLPPHSTHILQPLDVGLFSPLSKAYKQQISDHALFGASRITNDQFLTFFDRACKSAFAAKNIRSAWKATGLQPFNPQLILDKYPPPPPPPVASLTSSDGRTVSASITEPTLAKEIDKIVARLLQVCPSDSDQTQADIASLRRTCLTALAETTTLTAINQQLVEKAKLSRKTKEKKHFGEARQPTVEAALKKVAEKAKKEAEKVSEQERRLALYGKGIFAKAVYKEFAMAFDIFE